METAIFRSRRSSYKLAKVEKRDFCFKNGKRFQMRIFHLLFCSYFLLFPANLSNIELTSKISQWLKGKPLKQV